MEYIAVVKRRNPMISIAKAIGIILMVVGHVYNKESWGVHYIYMFHMPLFFVLSGYFFKYPLSKNDVLAFVKKKVAGLYIPYLLWTIFFILIHNFLLNYEIGTDMYGIHNMFISIFKSAATFVSTERVLVGFWFLKALFSACLYTALFGYATQTKKVTVFWFSFFSLLCIILMQFLGISNLTLFGMFYGSIFMGIGYLYKKYELEKVLYKKRWFMLFSVIVFIVSRIYSNIENTEMLNVDTTTFFPFTLTGCLGSFTVMQMSKKISIYNNKKAISFLRYIGDHTMIILTLHYPLIKIFDFYFIHNINGYNPVRLLLGGGIGVVVPIFIYRMFEIARDEIQKKHER